MAICTPLLGKWFKSEVWCSTVISKVKGHVDEDRVGLAMNLLMRLLTLVGVDAAVTDARKGFSHACTGTGTLWFATCIVSSLPWPGLWSMMMVWGGTAPNPVVWCSGAVAKRQRVIEAVRDFAMVPGPESLWYHCYQRWPLRPSPPK